MTPSSPSTSNSDTHARAWLKPSHVELMIDACLTDSFPHYLQDRNEAIIALLYDTGIRASELCSLNMEHVNLDTEPSSIYLPREIQKGQPAPATLELGKWGYSAERPLRRYLRDRWKDSEALFPSRSSPRLTTRSLERLVKKAARMAKVEPVLSNGGLGDPSDVSPHTLRHSVAYRIIQVEVGRLEDVQMRLRHANRSTTDQIYSHLIPR